VLLTYVLHLMNALKLTYSKLEFHKFSGGGQTLATGSALEHNEQSRQLSNAGSDNESQFRIE